MTETDVERIDWFLGKKRFAVISLLKVTDEHKLT